MVRFFVACLQSLVLQAPMEVDGNSADSDPSLSRALAAFQARHEQLIGEQVRKKKLLTLKKEPSADDASNSEGMSSWSASSLLEAGECRDREFAYFTRCVTDDESILNLCYASICSLLATTDPPCVVVFVSHWVHFMAKKVFDRNGIVVTIAPEWAPLPPDHPYAHLTGSTGNRSWDRMYTFSKFEAARLTQYKRVVAFDPDILFMRNASELTGFSGWAASRVPLGKNTSRYINNGMMVLQPSLEMYNQLLLLWRTGDYELYYSDEENGDQDVFTELCWKRGLCGPFQDLDACIWNHGSWLPNHFWRPCPSEMVIARHNFKGSREPVLAQNLARALQLGTCRKRASSGGPTKACFLEVDLHDEFGKEFSFERCCFGTAPEGDTHGGDPICWFQGATFERCCLGMDDAMHIQEDVSTHGDSWYGLSTLPDRPNEDWFPDMCERQYMRHRYTLSSLSPRTMRAHWEPGSEYFASVGLRGIKCRGVDGHLVVFYFQWQRYFDRHPDNRIARTLHFLFNEEPEADSKVAACIPEICCTHVPDGVQTSLRGVHMALWHFLTNMLWFHPKGILNQLPAPEVNDFGDVYVIDAQDMEQEWTLCGSVN